MTTMKRTLPVLISLALSSTFSFGQSKPLVGIAPFRSAASLNINNVGSVQDAVTSEFSKYNRLSVASDAHLSNDSVSQEVASPKLIEQGKAAGLQYVVTGNVTRANVEMKQSNVPVIGETSTNVADVSVTLNVIDVSTGEVTATGTINASGKGKQALDGALKDLRSQTEKFIKNNFKLTVSIAQIEDKNSNGAASSVLIAAGSTLSVKVGDVFRVFELTEITVDSKKLTRKKTLGQITITKVEDENFSVCTVNEGGVDIAKRVADGAKIKCELVPQERSLKDLL
jgi:hypothetical protein